MSHTTATATPSDLEIVFTRVFNAPRDLVWKMWTEPQHLTHWWGPKYFTTPVCRVDLRPGGKWHHAMRDPDGNAYWSLGIYREIVPPERLAYTDAFSNEQGDTIPPVTEVVVTFADQGARTLVTSTSFCATPEIRQQLLDMQIAEGVASMFECLDDYLLTATTEREVILTRDFDAPRDLVFKALTDPDHLPRWWGPAGFSCSTRSIDLREGGVWDFVMHGPDGTDYPNYMRYTELTRPERIAYINGVGPDDEHFRATITLEPNGAGTRLTMRMVLPSREERDFVVGFNAIELGYTTLQKLADHLAAMP